MSTALSPEELAAIREAARQRAAQASPVSAETRDRLRRILRGAGADRSAA